MFRSILVPLDGSSFAEQALPLAQAIARQSDSRLLLVTVSTPLTEAYVEGIHFSTLDLENEVVARHAAYLRAVAEQVRERTNATVETEVLRGDICSTLCELLSAGKADLVVMATHGRGALGRFWLGSVADEMIRLSPVPLLLVRPEEEAPGPEVEPSFGRVVIPLDGTPESEQVLGPAIELVSLAPQAEVVLMRAIHSMATPPTPPDSDQASEAARSLRQQLLTAQERVRQDASRYLEGVASGLRQRGARVRTEVVVEDSPAAAILQEAAKEHASLIALLTHGRRGLSRLLLGSVADKVVRGAHVPVLIQRPHPA